MEQTNIEPEVQAEQVDSELRPWVTPVFERISMKEALNDAGYPGSDGGSYGNYYPS